MSTKFEVKLEASRVLAMISGLGDKGLWKRALRSVVSLFTFKDVVDHFRKEQGPEGRWPALKPSYAKWKRKQGKTKMLQFTGQLRQGFLPSNIRDNDESSVVLFNPVEYAGKHDRGEGVPQRQFMWIGRRAQDLMDKSLVKLIVEGI